MEISYQKHGPATTPFLKLLHETLFAFLKLERRFDPFFRPALDAVFQEPLARGLQFLINRRRQRETLALAEEHKLPGEDGYLNAIVSEMSLSR